MATTGKPPGHGSGQGGADSMLPAIDNRSYRDIYDKDMKALFRCHLSWMP